MDVTVQRSHPGLAMSTAVGCKPTATKNDMPQIAYLKWL